MTNEDDLFFGDISLQVLSRDGEGCEYSNFKLTRERFAELTHFILKNGSPAASGRKGVRFFGKWGSDIWDEHARCIENHIEKDGGRKL